MRKRLICTKYVQVKGVKGAGTISCAQAVGKATGEYQKYQVQNLSPVEEESFYILYKYAY